MRKGTFLTALILALLCALGITARADKPLAVEDSGYGVVARGECGEGLTWVLTDDWTLTVSGTGEMTDFSNSGAPWASRRYEMKKLVLEEGVTRIGNYAFYMCYGFSGSLTIPDSVTSVGDSAFASCRGFTGELKLPAGLTEIGDSAFANCSGLSGGLTIPDSVTTIQKNAFRRLSGLDGTLVIGSGVRSIGVQAFEECSGLTSVLFRGNSLETIESAAFNRCRGLTGNLALPESVTTIEYFAFCNCSGLEGPLTLPKSLKRVEYKAFEGWKELDSVTFEGDAPEVFGDYQPMKPVSDYTINTNRVFGNPSFVHDTFAIYYYPSRSGWTTPEWNGYRCLPLGDPLPEKRGDVNGDGMVNSDDAIYLLRHVMSPGRYPITQSGDMNGDGAVNSNDAIWLLRHTMSPGRYPLAE